MANKELTNEEIEKNYAKFKKLLNAYVKREGTAAFIEWLDSTDAKIAPCSTKYHGNYAGGLIEHCLGVFMQVGNLMKFKYGDDKEKWPYSIDTIALVTLLHDVDKINKYKVVYRNVKNEAGEWEKIPSFTIRDDIERFAFGTHSENSVYIVSKYFDTTIVEDQAILYHMGGMDYSEKDCERNTSFMFGHNKLAFFLHVADLWDTAESSWDEEYDALSFIAIPETEETETEEAEEKNDANN